MNHHPEERISPEWKKVRDEFAAAKKRLDELAAEDEKPLFWNKAYPVEIVLPLFTGTAAFGSITIDAKSEFFVKGIEAHYSVTGTLIHESTPATLTIPETMRTKIFDYDWALRDSGTSRDWQNIPMSSHVLRSGNVQGLWFCRGQGRMRAGTRIDITVNPTFFDPTSTTSGLETFTSHSLQFILSGIAVKDGVL